LARLARKSFWYHWSNAARFAGWATVDRTIKKAAGMRSSLDGLSLATAAFQAHLLVDRLKLA
jgi:hypothetical protein